MVSEFSEATQGVTKLLEAKVSEMVASAQKRAAGQADAPLLPLVRLRVDYTGFSTINAQRFGQRFVGRVANPHDLLLFQKAPARKPKVLLCCFMRFLWLEAASSSLPVQAVNKAMVPDCVQHLSSPLSTTG